MPKKYSPEFRLLTKKFIIAHAVENGLVVNLSGVEKISKLSHNYISGIFREMKKQGFVERYGKVAKMYQLSPAAMASILPAYISEEDTERFLSSSTKLWRRPLQRPSL